MRKNFSISSFPQDNIVRVLYRYGGMQKNDSGVTISPHIQVLLAELDENGELVTQNFVWTHIKLNELHKAMLGSVWKGQSFLSKDFNLNGRIQSKEFIFRLDYFPPKNVNFNFIKKHFNELGCIPEILNYFNYPNIDISDKYNSRKLENFNKSNYTLLRSTKKDNVFISSIDVLNSLFCRNIPLKEKLLSTPIRDIVNDYFESYEKSNNTYHFYKVKTRNDQKKLADNTIKFLTFLALNKDVQNKISLLQSSLEDIEYNLYNYKNIERFPIILPPQTCQLKIKTLGFRYDNSFIVTKIKNVIESTYDHIVLHEHNKDSSNFYKSLYNFK